MQNGLFKAKKWMNLYNNEIYNEQKYRRKKLGIINREKMYI